MFCRHRGPTRCVYRPTGGHRNEGSGRQGEDSGGGGGTAMNEVRESKGKRGEGVERNVSI